MTKLKWWMRIVGAFYLLQFVIMVFIRVPIRTLAPEGTLNRASAGDPLARFLVDTWIAFGIEVGVIGAALLIASRRPDQARVLAWTVILVELLKGPVYDIYMIQQGYNPSVFFTWIIIHTVIIVTGFFSLRKAQNV